MPQHRWEQGESGNPSGRPKIPKEVIEACRAHSMRAIEVLAEMMEHSADDGVRIKAANSLLDRGYGKPVQAVELTGEGGGPTRMEIAYFNDWKSKDEVPSGDANGDDQGK